jgi:hypothetical protein
MSKLQGKPPGLLRARPQLKGKAGLYLPSAKRAALLRRPHNLNHASGSFVYVEPRLRCMKRNDVDGSSKRKALARRQLDQLVDRVKTGDAGIQFSMGLFWVVLGVACAALAWMLLTILLK